MPVPDFSPGEVLTAAAMDSIGLWKVASVDLAGQSAVNLDNCFSSDYNEYQVVVSSFHAGSAAYLRVQTRSAGSTDTGSNYIYSENNAAFSLSESNWRLAYAYNSTQKTNTIITVYNPTSTATGTMVYSTYMTWNGVSSAFTNYTHGQKMTSTADTGLRFTNSAGASAMQGIITVYGYRKA
jgi:hypothetical protein